MCAWRGVHCEATGGGGGGGWETRWRWMKKWRICVDEKRKREVVLLNSRRIEEGEKCRGRVQDMYV